MRRGFTLIELMIVVVIVGMLAALAMVQFSAPMEDSLSKEALANLKLIAAAEKIYRMEAGVYITATNETVINKLLRLSLPENATTKNWQYNVTATANGRVFNATATRTRGPRSGRTYDINQTSP